MNHFPSQTRLTPSARRALTGLTWTALAAIIVVCTVLALTLATDDAGDRDSAKRFHETIARLKGENIGAHKGRRTDRRPHQR